MSKDLESISKQLVLELLEQRKISADSFELIVTTNTNDCSLSTVVVELLKTVPDLNADILMESLKAPSIEKGVRVNLYYFNAARFSVNFSFLEIEKVAS